MHVLVWDELLNLGRCDASTKLFATLSSMSRKCEVTTSRVGHYPANTAHLLALLLQTPSPPLPFTTPTDENATISRKVSSLALNQNRAEIPVGLVGKGWQYFKLEEPSRIHRELLLSLPLPPFAAERRLVFYPQDS